VGTSGRSARPSFIVVEGPNGAGKTTLVEGLAAALGMTALGYSADFLRYRWERRLDDEVGPLARVLHYLAAIAELSDRVVASGGSVLCDRYWASPLAALEAEGALPVDVIDRIARPVLGYIARPELTLLLSAPPAVLAARVVDRDKPRMSASAAGVLASPAFTERWMDRLRGRSAEIGRFVEIDTVEYAGPALIDVAIGHIHSRPADLVGRVTTEA
jgi:thymidylate kinase